MAEHIGVKVKIMGLVQGVFFRAETRKAALSLGLRGYVRNLPDGSVEALFQGKKIDVENMLGWCKKGSPASRVDHIIEEDVSDEPQGFTEFEIRY